MTFPLELDGVKQEMTRHRWPLELSMRNKKSTKTTALDKVSKNLSGKVNPGSSEKQKYSNFYPDQC